MLQLKAVKAKLRGNKKILENEQENVLLELEAAKLVSYDSGCEKELKRRRMKSMKQQ